EPLRSPLARPSGSPPTSFSDNGNPSGLIAPAAPLRRPRCWRRRFPGRRRGFALRLLLGLLLLLHGGVLCGLRLELIEVREDLVIEVRRQGRILLLCAPELPARLVEHPERLAAQPPCLRAILRVSALAQRVADRRAGIDEALRPVEQRLVPGDRERCQRGL